MTHDVIKNRKIEMSLVKNINLITYAINKLICSIHFIFQNSVMTKSFCKISIKKIITLLIKILRTSKYLILSILIQFLFLRY